MEIMFILTTIFVAYVVYTSINGEKPEPDYVKKQVPVDVVVETTKAQPQAVVEHQEKSEVQVAVNVVAKPVAKSRKPKPLKPAPVVAVSGAKNSVRDPNTGEVTVIANNYRFIKRWIKEALVAEGLLDKVYKNNELDAEAEVLIKQALVTLENMEKYRV